MDEHASDNGYIYIDIRNWDKILREKKRFYLYDPFFVNGERVNLIQVWDYNADGSMTFNLLYTFEKNQKINRKEKFEEHYNPISKEIITDKLKELGYSDIQLYSFPSYISMDSFENTDWYTIIARRN